MFIQEQLVCSMMIIIFKFFAAQKKKKKEKGKNLLLDYINTSKIMLALLVTIVGMD